MDHQQLGFILFAIFLIAPAISLSEESALDKVKAEVESVLETKESRYKRELAKEDQKRKLEEDLRRQNEELEELAAQKRRLENQSRVYPQPSPNSGNDRSDSSGIEIFISSDCPDCQRTLGYLDALGVNYRLRELAPHTSAERDYLTNIGRGVIPVVRSGSQFVRGYLPKEIRKLVSKQTELGKTKSEKNKIGAVAQEQLDTPEPKLPKANQSSLAEGNQNNQFDVSGELKDPAISNQPDIGPNNEVPNK